MMPPQYDVWAAVRRGLFQAAIISAIWLAVMIAGLYLYGCSRVCAKTWETGTTVGHSAVWGDSVEQHVTVGGELGKEQCGK